MGRIVAFSKWDELTLWANCRFLEFGTNCRLGRIVAWDELSPNPNKHFTTNLGTTDFHTTFPHPVLFPPRNV